jgi:hypothetical protein
LQFQRGLLFRHWLATQPTDVYNGLATLLTLSVRVIFPCCVIQSPYQTLSAAKFLNTVSEVCEVAVPEVLDQTTEKNVVRAHLKSQQRRRKQSCMLMTSHMKVSTLRL